MHMLYQPFFERTRVLFGWHAGGYIVPIRLHLQLVDDTFTGLLQPVAFDEEYILVLADSRMVVAASQTSLLMLGVRGSCALLHLLWIVGACTLGPHVHRSERARRQQSCKAVHCLPYCLRPRLPPTVPRQESGASIAEDEVFIDKYLPPKVLNHLVVEASKRSHSDDRRKEVRSVHSVRSDCWLHDGSWLWPNVGRPGTR
jgi:hypothetical protein